MRFSHLIRALVTLLFATVCIAYTQTRTATIVRKEVALKFGEKVINAVKLENTHSRSYKDAINEKQCDLTKAVQGVIWRIICEGKDIPAKDISVQDEQGRKFQQTCWSSQGEAYTLDAKGNRIGGGPQTEFLAAGSDDSKKVKIIFGEASAEIEITK